MKNILIIIALCVVCVHCSNSDDPVIAKIGFEEYQEGEITDLSKSGIRISAAPDNAWISSRKGNETPNSLHIVGGESKTVEIVNESGTSAKYLSFAAERWTSRQPFEFSVEAFDGEIWDEIYKGDDEIHIGNFPKMLVLELPETKEQKIRIIVTAPEGGGALLDDLTFFSDADMLIDSVSIPDIVYPVLKGKNQNPVLNIQVFASGFSKTKKLTEVTVNTGGTDLTGSIKSVEVYYTGENGGMNDAVLFGTSQSLAKDMIFEGEQVLSNGINNFLVSYEVEENADISSSVFIECLSVKIGRKTYDLSSEGIVENHLGIALRQHSDDGVDTYRIPGLATTNNGSLIAVYDIRRNSGVDLQEDVDVGMSRSTDGGQSWNPMRVIMDMGEWGGLPDDQNGIGDPSVLVDRETNTIWVAAVWAHGHPGERNWFASQPGLDPNNTSQFVLVKSEDDGITWSEPINITKQIKKEEWNLLLQGPGKGISLKDGTLVFPAQYKDKNDMPHSTIIWSKDHGRSWAIGDGAKTNTTEAQVVELNEGSLMLNMRDNRNRSDKSETNGRAIFITADLGKTWQVHATSNGALQEPTCMASLIKEEFLYKGEKTSLMLFSNPNSLSGRHHMTIKISLDDGETWPEEHQLLIDTGSGRGYSCMTKIDDENIGILYEGSQADLIFQVFSIEKIMGGK